MSLFRLRIKGWLCQRFLWNQLLQYKATQFPNL